MTYSFTFRSLVLLGSSFALLACTTVQEPAPSRPGGPVVDRGPVDRPVPPTPSGSERPGTDRPDDTRVVDRPEPKEPDEPTTSPSVDAGERPVREGVSPATLAGQDVNRLALLLPFSSSNARLREEAASMLRAAELALFERTEDDTVLIVLDTQGTSGGAKTATKAAIDKGADVILGPVLAGSVKAASREARRKDVPVVAFSTDTNVAGNGTYLLSFPPEAEVARIVDYATNTGVTNFAILRPENAYGDRVARAYDNAVAMRGASVTAADSYRGNDVSVMSGPAKKMADFHAEQERNAGGVGKQAFEAVLLPEGGTALRSLAPLLPFYNSSMNTVQFMGTALWMREDTVREPALSGGIFAGPDRGAREGFESAYERAYGGEPSRLASLAHDAVDVGAIIAEGDPKEREQRAEDYQGFYGADGFVRFNPDGTPDRGLAVYKIVGGTFRVIDPAPRGPIGSN